MAIIIRNQDIVRVAAAMGENTSIAAAYFKRRPMHPSTHISAAFLKKEMGNIPVVGRGGPGIRPKHGQEVMSIEPMPIEIDDTLSAVEMDDYERANAIGKQQIVDEFLEQHALMIRETTNALCCQAHRGKIDYMMRTQTGLVRYVVEYGEVQTIDFTRTLPASKYNHIVQDLSALKNAVSKNGAGGPVEFVAAMNVYAAFVELLTGLNKETLISDGHLMIGPFKVYCDNDSYIDIVNDVKATKSLCDENEIVCRAVNAGQSMPYCRLDDTVQRATVPLYSFTAERHDHRGTDIFSKSKPFPLINVKGIAWGKYAP